MQTERITPAQDGLNYDEIIVGNIWEVVVHYKSELCSIDHLVFMIAKEILLFSKCKSLTSLLPV